MIRFDIHLVEYEVAGSWWAGYVSWGWAQTLAAKYFVWKARRKHRRYEEFVWRRMQRRKEKVTRDRAT